MTQREDVGSLCLACGLCCDGTLFDRVPLQPDESPPPGCASLVDDAGEAFFRQPCAKFDERCTIYSDRPGACRTFDCALVVRLVNGGNAGDDAHAIVTQAHAVVSRLDALTASEPIPLSQAGTARFPSPGADGQSPAVALQLAALNRLLDRHFRWPGQVVLKASPGAMAMPRDQA